MFASVLHFGTRACAHWLSHIVLTEHSWYDRVALTTTSSGDCWFSPCPEQICAHRGIICASLGLFLIFINIGRKKWLPRLAFLVLWRYLNLIFIVLLNPCIHNRQGLSSAMVLIIERPRNIWWLLALRLKRAVTDRQTWWNYTISYLFQ